MGLDAADTLDWLRGERSLANRPRCRLGPPKPLTFGTLLGRRGWAKDVPLDFSIRDPEYPAQPDGGANERSLVEQTAQLRDWVADAAVGNEDRRQVGTHRSPEPGRAAGNPRHARASQKRRRGHVRCRKCGPQRNGFAANGGLSMRFALSVRNAADVRVHHAPKCESLAITRHAADGLPADPGIYLLTVFRATIVHLFSALSRADYTRARSTHLQTRQLVEAETQSPEPLSVSDSDCLGPNVLGFESR